MTRRKKYSKEFKLDAVSLVAEQNYSWAEAARSLDINANMLGHWINQHQQDSDQSFHGNGKLTAEQIEIRRLKQDVKFLKMEKEILKKAKLRKSGVNRSYCLSDQWEPLLIAQPFNIRKGTFQAAWLPQEILE